MKSNLKFIILVFIPLVSIGQMKDFYDLDNSYHEIYRKSRVKSLKVYTKEYDNGKLTDKYLELIRNFDIKGNIVSEREFLDSDSTDGWHVKYKYNLNHQTIQTDWTWLEDNEQELAKYEYDFKGRLIKSCDYLKEPNEVKFKLLGCERFVYKNGVLDKVLSDDDSIIKFFKVKNDTTLKYSDSNVVESKYRNGELVYSKHDSTVIRFERNKIGLLLRSTEFDENDEVINYTDFEYSNGLLVCVTSKDCFGNLNYKSEYIYDYYE